MKRKNLIRNKVIVAGVGYSQIARHTDRTEGSLAIEACLSAIEDSGLPRDEIDGISVWPDRISSAFEGPPISYVHRALGLGPVRYWQAFGSGPAQLSSVVGAVNAIATGQASVVLAFRAHLRQEQRFYVPGASDPRRATGEMAFRSPYGLPAGAPRWAMWAQRRMHEFGSTEEHMGAVVLTCREHAQLAPRAVWNGQPLTMDDYLDAPFVATPLRILDCDMPVDGAVAIILASADRVSAIRPTPVWVESMAHASGTSLDVEQWPDMSHMASRYVADELWAGTDLVPGDVDVAQVYDGFSFLALNWMEDLGFCGRGEAGDFLLDGQGRIGGQLPICTDGGQLGGGRLHGFGKLAESVLQLRGECGERQVPDARVALACAGGGPAGTAMILTR